MRKVGALVAVMGVAAAGTFSSRDAKACGGCFHPPAEIESVITDEQMMLSISKDQTTLYDEIKYQGSPASFAWVLPIKGKVTVGLSADVMFNSIDYLTKTQVIQPNPDCPPPPTCNNFGYPVAESAGAASDAGAGGGEGGGPPPVTVISQETVGPYEEVQLSSTDGSALTNWLVSHGYQIQKPDVPIIKAYVSQGFDFLALKLVPGKDVHAMRPVRVTTQGASISLPLHMVAVGTGPTTGITIWVVADGRWEPSNFPTFTITDPEIAWDWNTNSSNYESLRLSKEAEFKGRGWQIESSLSIAKYSIQNLLTNNVQAEYYQGKVDYPGAPDTSDAGASADAGPDASVGQVDAADEDLKVLFQGIAGGNVRVTRMRSDVAHASLSEDMFLAASKDQSEMSNIHNPEKQIGQPLCPIYDNNCEQTGTVPRDQAVAAANARNAGCNATRSTAASDFALAALAGVLGISAFRFRRRRAK